MFKYFVFFCPLVAISLVCSYNNNDQEIKRIIIGIDKALDYINYNSLNFNVDGLLGVVLSEVHLNGIIENGINDHLVKYLAKKARSIYNKVYPILDTSDGFDNIFKEHLLVHAFWHWENLKFKSTILDKNFKRPIIINNLEKYIAVLNNNTFDENFSDSCINQLIESKNKSPKCEITPACQNVMYHIEENDSGYSVTHKLLFLQLKRGLNCEMSKTWYRKRTKFFCNNILWEVNLIKKFGFPKSLNDLLLEQMLLCAINGYAEFLDNRFMEAVLKMEMLNGCFSPLDVFHNRRAKRKANVNVDGCVDHTNGLGVALLSVYLRYLMTT